jgi:hypothetical protein
MAAAACPRRNGAGDASKLVTNKGSGESRSSSMLNVTAAKLPPVVRRHRLPVREPTLGIAEDLERAAVLFAHTWNALIAARGHDDGAAGRQHADLMGIDAGVECRILRNFASD